MLTLGIDPTVRQCMGYALIAPGGAILKLGDSRIPTNMTAELARRHQATVVLNLIAEHRVGLVCLERPVFNKNQVARFGSGAALATLDLALAVGAIEQAAQALCPVMLVHPSEAKEAATGNIIADKNAMRDAAHIRLSENSELSNVRRPPEHQADALFIALAGLAKYRSARLLEKAS